MKSLIRLPKHHNSEATEESFPINDLPVDVLERVFVKSSGEFIRKNAVMVCKKWKEIIENEHFWIQKGVHDGRIDRRVVACLHNENIYEAKVLYFKKPFSRNLIKNPCGDEGFKHWCVNAQISLPLSNDKGLPMALPWDFNKHKNLLSYYQAKRSSQEVDGLINNWKVQTEHNGSKPFLVDGNVSKNFVTSYHEGTKFQLIDLVDEGLRNEILDAMSLTIDISENYAARFDCGSKYCLIVKLLDDKFHVLDTCFKEDRIAQWNDGSWFEFKHSFVNIPKNTRYVFYHHAGSDTQYWAGFYGIKITNSNVRLRLQ